VDGYSALPWGWTALFYCVPRGIRGGKSDFIPREVQTETEGQ
jgi:hypothetical protein